MNPASFYAFAITFEQREVSMLHLGLLLCDAMPLPQALRQIAITAEDRKVKVAAARAAELMAAGNSASDVFARSEMKAFSPRARYILASPLTEDLKGRLLSGWRFNKTSAFAVLEHLYYPAQILVFGMLVVFFLAMFVLPQFREIMMGSGIEPQGVQSWVFKVFFEHDILAILFAAPAVFVVLMAVVFFVSKTFFGAYKSFDELNLLRLLKAVPAADRFKVLEVMAAPHNFPRLGVKLKAFARAINNGEEIIPACREAGLDSAMAWFVQLSAGHDENSLILEQGAQMLESQVNCALERSGRMLEIFSVLMLGLGFGLITYTVFQSMITIMMGAIS